MQMQVVDNRKEKKSKLKNIITENRNLRTEKFCTSLAEVQQ